MQNHILGQKKKIPLAEAHSNIFADNNQRTDKTSKNLDKIPAQLKRYAKFLEINVTAYTGRYVNKSVESSSLEGDVKRSGGLLVALKIRENQTGSTSKTGPVARRSQEEALETPGHCLWCLVPLVACGVPLCLFTLCSAAVIRWHKMLK